jgi:perosamine synthetase
MIPVARPAVADAELDRIREVFESRWLGQGKLSEQFESAISEQCGGRPALVVNTGTTAMHLALSALGIGPGDEVIVPSLTYVATAQAVTATGATVVLCDVNRDTMNVDVRCLEAARTSHTKAVMPVHYRGLPAEIGPILDWASDHGIRVVEDAAHAFGSLYEDGTPVGARGDVTCFSFDPIKNVTTGEGGALVFEHQEERDRGARMRALGIDTDTWSRTEFKRPWEYDVVDDGFRYHMPNFCAAIGLAQLERFHTFRERKQAVLARYQAEFANNPHLEIPEMPVERCFPFLALVLVDERDRFMAHMKERGVGTGVHYIPAHRFSRFADAAADDLPVSDWLGDRICSLPLMNDQTEEETAQVIEAVMAFNGRS